MYLHYLKDLINAQTWHNPDYYSKQQVTWSDVSTEVTATENERGSLRMWLNVPQPLPHCLTIKTINPMTPHHFRMSPVFCFSVLIVRPLVATFIPDFHNFCQPLDSPVQMWNSQTWCTYFKIQWALHPQRMSWSLMSIAEITEKRQLDKDFSNFQVFFSIELIRSQLSKHH